MENGPFPPELLLSIFIYLDGLSLATCSQVCRQWSLLLSHYDHLIWPSACQRDFESTGIVRRFWSVQFPAPCYRQLRWQDMYRITRNWYTGHCRGFYPTTQQTHQHKTAYTVIGTPQEQGMLTSLSMASGGRVVRSNPNYHQSHHQSLMIQSAYNKQCIYRDHDWSDATAHVIVCHYTHPSLHWLVTGGLDGSVAVWDLDTQERIRIWHGHRGRVLCVSMNEDMVVVSGGSDSMVLVWDFDPQKKKKKRRRGAIDIASYLSDRMDWYQGIGEIAIHGHLIACAPDASGPILIFSVLTGALVYEIRSGQGLKHEWMSEEITAFPCLCLTPFFLLAKSKVDNYSDDGISLIPSSHNAVLQRTDPMMMMPETSACINVWDLQTGEIKYRLVPTLDQPHLNYTITDIRVTPDWSRVFASIEIRGRREYEERVYCWDFSVTHVGQETQSFDLVQLDTVDKKSRKTGHSWVCFV